MGFKIIGVGVNEKFPQFDTYIFENTQELNEILYKLTNKGEIKNGKADYRFQRRSQKTSAGT